MIEPSKEFATNALADCGCYLLSADRSRIASGCADLATLVMRALAVQPAEDATASAARYGGAELRASEQQREQQRQESIAELRRRFVDGPVLVIPGRGGGSFDARGAVAIPGVGTVYFGMYRFSGDWGTLEAARGVLVTRRLRSRPAATVRVTTSAAIPGRRTAHRKPRQQ